MKKRNHDFPSLFYFILFGFLSVSLYGQQILPCGTEFSPTEINYLNQSRAARQSFDLRTQRGVITIFPIQQHVVRKTDGSGGITPTQLTAIVANLNSYYQNANIQFSECGPVRYINNDIYYDFNANQENSLGTANDVSNVINIYYFNSVTSSTGTALCGYTYAPPNTIDRILMSNSCAINGSTILHEMGHYFSLYHTHGKGNCITTDELVTRILGQNCEDHGDDLCDTPADPNLSDHSNNCLSSLVNSSCIYTGTAKDANGDTYSPLTNNIMSYSRTSCRNVFTNGQYSRIAYSSTHDRSYLHCPCTYHDSYEPNNSETNANQTAFYSPLLSENAIGPTSIQGTICEDDFDFYQFRSNHKGIVQFDIINPSGKNYDLDLYTRAPLSIFWNRQTTNLKIDGNTMFVYRNEPSFGLTRNYAIKIFGANTTDFGPNPYTLTMTWLPDCASGSNRMPALVSIDQGNQISHCSQSTTLTVSGGFVGYNYHWFSKEPFTCLNNDCSNISISPTSSALYTVVSPGGSCCSIDSIYVTLGSRPSANAGSNVTIQLGASTQLQGSGGGTYKWSPTSSLNNSNIYNPIASPTVITTYTLTVTNTTTGCTDTDDITVTVQGTGGGAPANDNPCSATTLSVGSGCSFTTGTNVGATATSGVASPSMCTASSTTGNCCGSYAGGDVWFKATVPNSGKLIISTQIQSSVYDLVLGIYTGSCGSLTQIYCNDDRVPGSNYMPYISMTGLSSGTTVYIRVWEFGNNVQGTFGICAQDPGGITSNDPDLTISIDSINTTSPDPGDDITVSMTVTNSGTVNATNSFTARLVLSSDAYLDYSDDDYISGTSHSISSLNVGASVTFSETGTIPSSTSSGNYFIIAEVDVLNDQVDESNESNNTANRSIVVGTISPTEPDLDVFGESATPSSSLAPGMQISVVCTVENQGLQAASSARVGYFFSENSTYNPGLDIYLGDDGLGTLDPSETSRETATLNIPNVNRTGTHYILFVADYQNVINDIDRANNDESYSINISTATPALPDYAGTIFEVAYDTGQGNTIPISPHSIVPYNHLVAWLNINNIGNLDGTQDFRTKVVISDDAYMDANDFLVGFGYDYGGIDFGNSDTYAPDEYLDGIDLGPKYIIAQIDEQNTTIESNENNNKIVFPITIIAGNLQLPDITIQILGVNPGSGVLGDSIEVNFMVANIGQGTAQKFDVDFFLSEDQIFDGDRIENDMSAIYINDTIFSGDTVYFNRNVLLANAPFIGAYYILGVADENRSLAEIDKSNNFSGIPFNVTALPCWIHIEHTVDTFPAAAGNYNLGFRTGGPSTCPNWQITSDVDWIGHIYSIGGQSSSGNMSSYYNANNYPFTRVGHVYWGNDIYTVVQLGCEIDPVNLGNDTIVCGGIVLDTGFDTTFTYNWSTGETTSSINVTSTALYSVTATNGSSCKSIDTIQVTVSSSSAIPSAIIASQNPLCFGNSSVLSLYGGSLGAGCQWKWYEGSCGGSLIGTGNQVVVSPTTATSYFVRAEGCDTTVCVSITINLLPVPPVNAGQDDTISVGGSKVLTATGGVDYLWITGETTPSITVSPSLTTTYFVFITDDNGCVATDSVRVVVVGGSLTIAGLIKSETGSSVMSVNVNLMGSSANNVITSNDALYSFNLIQAGDYTVTPSKNNDIAKANGVTTLDIVRIRRHILGSQLLSSPYKIIAADVNGNNAVTSLDISILRKFILGIDTTFNGRLWAFVPSDFVFVNPVNPFPFDKFRSYLNISSSQTNQDFIGVKLGDVDNGWNPLTPKMGAVGEVQFAMNEYQTQPNDEIIVPVKVRDFNSIGGYQFTLTWNPEVLQLLEVANQSIPAYYGEQSINEGILTTSWNDASGGAVTLNDDAVAFELKFKVVGTNGTTSEIKIGSEITNSEAYTSNLDLLEIISANGFVKVGEQTTSLNPQPSTLHPQLSVQPNPFSNTTNIIFSIPQDELVSITIYDLLGRQVKQIRAQFTKGEHRIEWAGDDENGNQLGNGLYHIRMEAGGDFIVAKAIIMR